MTHEEIEQVISEFVHGELSESDARDVGAHVESCAFCRELASTYRGLHAAAAAKVAIEREGHLPSEDLVSFATDDGTLGPERRLEIATHLDGCAECRGWIETVRAAEEELENPVRGASRGDPSRAAGRWWWGWAAAAVLVVALWYPAYLGLVRLPEMQRRLADSQSETASLRTAAQTPVMIIGIAPGFRGENDKNVVLVGPGEACVLSVEPVLLGSSATAEHRFVLSNKGGRVLREWSFRPGGVVGLPVGILAPG